MSPFRYHLRVRYAECDAQKVVFNARYGEYADHASTEFFRAIGFGYGQALQTGEIDMQVVKQTTEWRAPVRFDQVVEISVTSPHQGNTSFTLRCEYRIAGSAELCAVTETVYVVIDGRHFKKCPLPDRLRAALVAGAPGAVTDHAGYLPGVAKI